MIYGKYTCMHVKVVSHKYETRNKAKSNKEQTKRSAKKRIIVMGAKFYDYKDKNKPH